MSEPLSSRHDATQIRSRAALLGLALGDALSWPALFHRSYGYPFWTRRLRREMDVSAEEAGVLRPQIPFSLNQPPEGFAPGPTDDTEWAAFVMQTLLEADESAFAETSLRAWQALARETAPVRGSVSTQAALDNLRKGKEPPVSGHDNPHYFDDGACARAVPLGVWFAGEPEKAAAAAGAEAQITNAQEGVWAAQAVAASVSVACAGGTTAALVAVAQEALPPESWIARTVAGALQAAQEAPSLLDLILTLAGGVVNREYNYGTSAPETLAVALALTAYVQGDAERGIPAATAIAKAADAAVALTGTFCGALTGSLSLPTSMPRALRGVCVPALTGVAYPSLVEAWLDRAARARRSHSS